MAGFTDFFIKRPVLATVISLLLFIFGIRSLFTIPLQQYPKMNNTVITVQTAYPGATAALMQGFVSTPIEKAIASADGIDYFTSQNDNSVSTVTAYVRLGFDPDKAFVNIMSKVSQVKNQLPKEAQNPVITKTTGSQVALLYMSFSSQKMTPQQITAYINQVIQPKLETLPGVAEVNVLGGENFAMRVWLRPARLAALGVTPSDVSSALTQNNFQAAAGTVNGNSVLLTVAANTNIESVAEFNNLVIKRNGARLVRLGDVAKVELGSESYNSSVSFNGERSVFISINPTPTANPLTVIHKVRGVLPQLSANYPPSLHSAVVYDATKFIQASINEVTKTILEASVIVIFIIYLFIGSLRTVLIPLVTIPLSLVSVFGFMWLMGYSSNLLTLLALVLAIGLVVDDAIVVVENTYRYLEEGLSPLDAAIKGARDIAAPVVAMTITLAAVYAPIGLMGGMTGALFKEFAFTLAGAVILSGVIALTLSPMMCAKILHSGSMQGRMATYADRFFQRTRSSYASVLAMVLRMPMLMTVFSCSVLASCVLLYQNGQKELAPNEDQGVVLSVITGPKYANLNYMERFSQQIQQAYLSIPSRENYFLINGAGAVNSGFSMLMLKPWDERKESQAAVARTLAGSLSQNAGLQVFPIQLPALPSSGMGPPVQFVLTSTGSYPALYRTMQRMVEKAQNSGHFIFINGSLDYDKPMVNLEIDRNKAALLGVSMQQVAGNLAASLGGGYINQFSMFDRGYKVIPQWADADRSDSDQINHLYFKNASGQMVPLSAFSHLHYTSAPNSLSRFNQLNSATLSGVIAPGQTMGDAVAYLQQLAKKTLSKDTSYDYAGELRQYMQEGSALMEAFVFSLIVIFLVLAAQFESYALPLVVMTSVPMAICGALIPLNWGLSTINIYTQIGLITLIGLITKHGILIVTFANNLREQRQVSKYKAITEAAAIRLRPVLMTTAAMALGVVPLLLASGAGAASRFSLGLVIFSGMLIGTLFTLFVVPMMYLFSVRRILTIWTATGALIVLVQVLWSIL